MEKKELENRELEINELEKANGGNGVPYYTPIPGMPPPPPPGVTRNPNLPPMNPNIPPYKPTSGRIVGYTTHCIVCGRIDAIYFLGGGKYTGSFTCTCGGEMVDDDPIYE